MRNPKETYLIVVYRILPYLNGALEKAIIFTKACEMVLEAYTNANYVGSIDKKRSIFTYCTCFWRKFSHLDHQQTKYCGKIKRRVMIIGICEILLLKIVLEDLKIDLEKSTRLHCDNKSLLNIAHNLVQLVRTKHVEVDRDFIKETLDIGKCTPFVSFGNKFANVLTKRSKWGHISIYCWQVGS